MVIAGKICSTRAQFVWNNIHEWVHFWRNAPCDVSDGYSWGCWSWALVRTFSATTRPSAPCSSATCPMTTTLKQQVRNALPEDFDAISLWANMHPCMFAGCAQIRTADARVCGWLCAGATKITPLILAICKKSFYTAQNLIEFGADINKADENGVTPLMYAVKYVSVSIFYFIYYYNFYVAVKSVIM